jgi:hypothetical protein
MRFLARVLLLTSLVSVALLPYGYFHVVITNPHTGKETVIKILQ